MNSTKKIANYGLHRGITRNQKALKKEELVEVFDRKFSIEILEKAFHALRLAFYENTKKYQKEGKLPIKVGNSTKACFSCKRAKD